MQASRVTASESPQPPSLQEGNTSVQPGRKGGLELSSDLELGSLSRALVSRLQQGCHQALPYLS